MKIERVTVEDAAALLAVYAPYVEKTAVSFEYEVPTVEEFRARIRQISEKYPYLKAVENGEILGYAYANTFKDRRAYDWSVETTVYLREDVKRRGIGRQLYAALERSLRGMGVRNMNACIASVQEEDPYLTDDSRLFHTRMGFALVGRFHRSGYKFGRWYDMIWMEKLLEEASETAGQVRFGAWELEQQA